MDIKFSIILPVYNVEKYLSRCLESLINQTYKNLEIICINDGSTDNSLKVLEEYVLKDSRIKIFTQENLGVSAARNSGIEKAQGEYISFIDPDDYVEINMFEKLKEYIETKSPSVLMFKYDIRYEQSGKIIKNSFSGKMKRRFGIDLNKREQFGYNDFPKDKILFYMDSSCNKIYSKEVLNIYNFRFPSLQKGEDSFFALNILLHKIPIDYIDEVCYHYCVRAGSAITAKQNFDTMFIFSKLDYMEKMLQECGLYNDLAKGFSKYKIRSVYEAEKKALPELKEKVLSMAKEKLNKNEYLKFEIYRIFSKVLRETFSIRKNCYVDGNLCNVYKILGHDIRFQVRQK